MRARHTQHQTQPIRTHPDHETHTEVAALRQRVAELERSLAHHEQAEHSLYQLQTRLQRQMRHLAVLQQVSMLVGSNLDTRLIFDLALDYIHTHTGVDATAVFVRHPHLPTLTYSAGRGLHHPVMPQDISCVDQRCASCVATQQRHPILITDMRQHHGHVPGVCPHMKVAEAFTFYYGLPLIARGQVKGVLSLFHRSSFELDQEWFQMLDTLASQVAVAIDNSDLVASLRHANDDMALAYDTTLAGWARALEMRDKETQGHSQRVTRLTLRLAAAMGVPEADHIHVQRGALLHDIGKMGVPDTILLKPGPLSTDEWAIMRQHPTYAYEMLRTIPFLRHALDIPCYHHERWDGTGYPHGLSGEAIPLVARIFAVVDVWDALRSDRPYRRAWSVGQVRSYIREQSGTHFDPRVVDTFLNEMQM